MRLIVLTILTRSLVITIMLNFNIDSCEAATKLIRLCERYHDEEEYEVYKSLPDKFTVYRGVAIGRNPNGLSWTKSKSKAEWFSHRFDKNNNIGYVQSAIADKQNVLAYFNSRDEDEIVVDPKTFDNINIIS